MPGPTIFISYRRNDAAGSARALFLMLRSWFGESQVFFDQSNLAAGDVFSDRLRHAIRSASLTLAVIGPTWLEEINRRAEAKNGVDVVREELKLALHLQAAEPDRRSFIPILMEHDAMPQQLGLHASLGGDLGAMWQYDAHPLGGKQSRWDHAVRELLRVIQSKTKLVPLPTAGDAARFKCAHEEVNKALSGDPMQPLREAWGPDPLHGGKVEEVEQLVVGYARGVLAALPGWRSRSLSEDQLVDTKRRCLAALSALYGLAIDGSAARAWVEEPDGRRPVPVVSVVALAFAHAVATGKKASISLARDDLGGALPEGTVDLGQPDPGAGSQRRATVQQQLWEATFTDPRTNYPRGSDPLSEKDTSHLRSRLKARARIEGIAFGITEVQQPESQADSDLQVIADELGIVALPRTGQDRGLLRVDEQDFNALIAECLKYIESIK